MSKVVEDLSQVMDKENAKKIAKLTKNYDRYMIRFKKELNELINPLGYEVRTGILFQKMEAQLNGE